MSENHTPGYRMLKRLRSLVKRTEDEQLKEAFTEFDGYMRGGGEIPEQWDPILHGPGRPPMPEGDILTDVQHGTYGGYRKGCRCRRCRETNTKRARVYRQKRRETQESS